MQLMALVDFVAASAKATISIRRFWADCVEKVVGLDVVALPAG
jgi:hypothetical protein